MTSDRNHLEHLAGLLESGQITSDEYELLKSRTEALGESAEVDERAETGISRTLVRLSSMELGRHRGLQARVLSLGEVDRLQRSSHGNHAPSDGVSMTARVADVAIDSVWESNGSLVVFPAVAS